MKFDGKIMKKIREEKGITQKEIARRLFYTEQCIYRWERGDRMPKADDIDQIAKFLQVPSTVLYGVDSDLSKTDRQNYLEIKLISQNFLSAIHYIDNDMQMEYDGAIKIDDSELAECYPQDSLTAMRVEGDSMEPQISSGDCVVFVESSQADTSGLPCVVNLNGRLVVRAIEQNKSGYLLYCANQKFAPRQITENDVFSVVGKVVRIVPALRKPKAVF